MKVLVTGFDPFGGENVNPAYEAVRLLPGQIAGAQIFCCQIPTSYVRSGEEIARLMEEIQPDVVLNVGQAGGRSCVTVERLGVNLAEARIPDNDGFQPMGSPLIPGGDGALYATIPVFAAAEAVRRAGLPCHISYSAGTFVCNAVMYRVLDLCRRKYPGTRAGFVHVPYIPAQVVSKPNGTPSMAISDIVRSLEAILEAAVTVQEDVAMAAGQTH